MRANFFWLLLIFFGGGSLGLLIISYSQPQRQLKAWMKSLGLNNHLSILQTIYDEVDGFILSRQARNRHDALDYIYGEIDFLSFAALLSLAKPNNETIFYDLGSGTGKAVFTCALVYRVKKCVGIEILPELHHAACAQKQKLAHWEQYKNQAHSIHFILGDFLQLCLTEANYVFVNSSSLFGLTWEALCQRLNNLPDLEIIITTSKPLISTVFIPKISTKVQMSWGVVPAFIHSRKTFSNKAIENIE